MNRSNALLRALSVPFVAALLAGGLPAHAQTEIGAGSGTEQAVPSKGELRLAKLLEGRVAGKPVDCIRILPSDRMQTSAGAAYVYGEGGTIYVQRTRNPQQIDRSDTLVSVRPTGTQLCRGEPMSTVDPVTGIFTGVVQTVEFVPYTRTQPTR